MIENPLLTMTPQEIVQALDNHIIGQKDAKKSVANALRNRYRRLKVDPEIRTEITPKNILMIGPTGVGKTEIARRLARLANAPFIKVEATKFTEVGYVGRDVESIIRDLVDNSVKLTNKEEVEKVKDKAASAAEERILDALLPGTELTPQDETTGISASTRQIFRKKLREGQLDDKDVELEVSGSSIGVEIVAPPGMEEMTHQLQGLFQNLSGQKMKKRKMKVVDAIKHIQEEEASKLINDEEIKAKALERVEQTGIVFLDEIDKVTHRSDDRRSGGDVSREGVQRDLLPLIEGCTVSTKYGMVKTDHILFITSGAFHLSRPSDLIPELQGRLPVRVELDPLNTEDFVRILTEPSASLTEQYTALMETEKLMLKFSTDGVKRIAEIAFDINEKTENIGARRLHTVMERLLEELSFGASDKRDETFTVDKKYVNEQLDSLIQDEDLSRFIL